MSYNEWLDIEVLEDYLDGKLDAKTMHQVEKLSLEDPFVAEALAGLSQSPRRAQSLSLLQKQLQERIAQKPIVQKRWRITSQRLSIAATAAVLFVTVSLLFWMRENKRQEIMAGQPKNVEVNIAPEATKASPEVKETPEVKTIIDKALADAKNNTLANNKKSAPQRSKASTSVSAADVSAFSKQAEQNKDVAAKESQVNAVIAAAPVQMSRALQGRIEGLAVAKNTIQVTGKVVDEDGKPIPGASIKIKGANLIANTNTKGEFTLTIDSSLSQQKLAIGSVGYQEKEVEVKANEQLHVALEQNANTLSEVVVTGYGNKAKKRELAGAVAKISVSSSPVDGWEKFEQYLLDNNKLLKNKTLTDKTVMLSFNINEKGRPVDIKVVQTLTKFENDEAIRLLQNGPKWTVPAKGSAPIIISVKF